MEQEDKLKKLFGLIQSDEVLGKGYKGVNYDDFKKLAAENVEFRDALHKEVTSRSIIDPAMPFADFDKKTRDYALGVQPKVAAPPISQAPPQQQARPVGVLAPPSLTERTAQQAVQPMQEQPVFQPFVQFKNEAELQQSALSPVFKDFGAASAVMADREQMDENNPLTWRQDQQTGKFGVFEKNDFDSERPLATFDTKQQADAAIRTRNADNEGLIMPFKDAEADFAKMSPEQQKEAIQGSTGSALEQQKANEKRSGFQKIKDFGKTLGGIATNAYDAILASERLLGAKQRDLLTFGGAEENLKKVKQEVTASMSKIENEYAQELRDNNIETSIVDAINNGELSRLPEAIGYNVANAIVSGLGAAVTGGYSMFAQTLAQDYKSGVENLARETNRTPEQVIADGDDAELIPAISATIQSLIEKAQIGLASKAIDSKGAYKYIRDLVVKNTGNSKWAKAAGVGLGLGAASLESGAQGAAQEVASIASEEAAGSDSLNKFYDKLGKTLSSEAGQKRLTESLIGEAIGAGGIIAAGRAGSRILGNRSPSAPPTQTPPTPPTQLGGIPTIPAPPNAPEFTPKAPVAPDPAKELFEINLRLNTIDRALDRGEIMGEPGERKRLKNRKAELEAQIKPTEVANVVQSETETETSPTSGITFENAKEGDVVLQAGKPVTVVGRTKSRAGRDVIEVREAPRTKDEIKQTALQNVFNRVASQYGNRRVTWADIEANHPVEVRKAIDDETALERSRTATFTIDAEQWANEVTSENESQPATESETTYVTVSPEELQAFRVDPNFATNNPERAAAIADDVALIQSGQMDINAIDDANYRVMVESALGANTGADGGGVELIQENVVQEELPVQGNEVEIRNEINAPLKPEEITDVGYFGTGISAGYEDSNQSLVGKYGTSDTGEASGDKLPKHKGFGIQVKKKGDKQLISIHFPTFDHKSTRGGGHAAIAFEIPSNIEVTTELIDRFIPVVEKYKEDNYSIQNGLLRANQEFKDTIPPDFSLVLPTNETPQTLADQAQQNLAPEANQPVEAGAAPVATGEPGRPVVEGAAVPQTSFQGIESFETAKGSVYTVLPDGRTQRFKTATNEQDEPQDLTVFVKFKDADQEQDFLQGVQRSESSGTKVYLIDQQGNKYDTNEQAAGKDVRLALVKDGKVIDTVETSTTPKVGYNTFDQRRFKKDGEQYRQSHLGNKVVKINATQQTPAQQVATLRAKEQAEYDAMPDPNDVAKREEIYGRYDKLIREAQGEKAAPVAKEKAAPTTKEEGKPKPEAKPKAEKGGAKESLAKRLKGDALLDAEDTLAELSDNGATINPDGTVVVYHRTTKDKADAIVKNNEMFGLEDGVFFSTSEKGQAEGYGDVVVKMNVPIEQIQIDDTFGNEAHVRIPTKKANQKIPVSNFSPQLAKSTDPFATFDTKGEEKALTEKEFYKKYTAQHKDIRAQSLEEKQATKNKILAEGFKEQGRNVNALPIYRGPDGTITDKQYGNKKGDFVYLLPKEGVVNTRNGYVNKAGYIPGKFDVVEIEYDGQPTYEAYSNQFKKAADPFATFDTKGEDARKVREALKQEVGPEMFRQMQLAHKNAEKILRSLPETFKIDCP
jgi:hypothetical protein